MKKLILALTLAFAMIAGVTAQESTTRVWDHGDNISNITYQNVRILKVLDSTDAYVVLYAKQSLKVGQCTIPKTWAKESPRKLEIRNKPPRLDPYMTIIKQDGEFLKVWLTLPNNKLDTTWGILKNGYKPSGLDAEILEIEL